MMIPEIDLPFYYLGSRNYVNGLTIMEEMIKAYLGWKQQNAPWIEALEIFRINYFVRCACRLEIHQAEPPQRESLLRSAARMTILTADGQKAHLLLMQESDRDVRQRRTDYDRGQYILDETVDSQGVAEATLYRVTDLFTLMRGIVEVNYRYCCDQALKWDVSSGVSWAYLNYFKCPAIDAQDGLMHLCFSKASIIKQPDKVFIIRQFHLRGQDPSRRAEIGFFFDLPSAKW